MVNDYISFLKLAISCSQNCELIFCKNNEAIPRKVERLVLKSQHLLFHGTNLTENSKFKAISQPYFFFVNLPGIFHLFLLLSTINKSLIIEIKNILFLSRKVGRNFRNPSTKFALFLT
jgi:hypothetical protein